MNFENGTNWVDLFSYKWRSLVSPDARWRTSGQAWNSFTFQAICYHSRVTHPLDQGPREVSLLLAWVRNAGVFLIGCAVAFIHYFTTPAEIRIANILLAAGLVLCVVSLWPIRRHLIARFQEISSGREALIDLGKWLTGKIQVLESRTRGWHVVAVLLGLFLLSLVSSKGGILDPELDQYIPHYLSEQSFLAKTFDSTMVEVGSDTKDVMWHGRLRHLIGLQRPRPLSYFLDCLDAQVIAWSVSKGFPHLLSASNLVFLVLIYAAVWIFCRRYLRFDRLTAGLLVCIVASDPVLACNLSYFRSAKPGTSTFLLIGLCAICALLVRRREFPPGAARTLLLLAAPIALLTACLFDEQGILLTGIILVGLLIEWRRPANPVNAATTLHLLISVVSALVVCGIYGFVIHPRLCSYFADVPPAGGLEYQAGAIQNILREGLARTWQALFLLVDQFRFLTGSQVVLPAILMMLWMGAISASGAAFSLAAEAPDKGVGAKRGVLIHLSVAGTLIVLTLAALCSRHEWLLRYDMRRWLYSEPTTMVLLVFLLLTTAAVLTTGRFPRPVVQLALAAMLLGNLWMFPEHRRFLRSGYWMPRLELSEAFLRALKQPASAPVPPEVAASAAFQALRAYVPVK